MFGYASQRDRRADAAADLARAQARQAPRRRAQGRGRARTCARTARRRSRSATATARPVEIEKLLISTQHREGAESLIPDDLWEHVVEPVLPRGPLRRAQAAQELPRQPDRPLRDRRPGGRLRPDRAQDHRRHLRRHGPPRRRRVLGQGPEQGRPLGRLRGALRGQERRRGRPGRPLRGAGRLRDRRRAPGVGDGRDVRDREDRPRAGSSRWSTSTSTCARARSASTCKLHRPIYQKTAAYGHFGREDHDFTWERTDKAARAARGRRPRRRRRRARSDALNRGRTLLRCRPGRGGPPGGPIDAESRLDTNVVDYAILAIYFVVVLGVGFAAQALHQDQPRLLPVGALAAGLDHRPGVHLGQPGRDRGARHGRQRRAVRRRRRSTTTGSARSRRWSSSAS